MVDDAYRNTVADPRDMPRSRAAEAGRESLLAQPERLICIAILAFSAFFFLRHAVEFYRTVDFTSNGINDSHNIDFFVFYSAARYLWDGAAAWDLYDSGLLKAFQVSLGASENGLHPFNYPPTYLFIILPLGALPFPIALVVWQVVTLALFALCLKIAGLRWLELCAVMVAPVMLLNLAGGQNGYLTSALLIAGLALLNRHGIGAGILFGLLTFKPHLGLLVPVVCLAERRWKTIITAACVGIAMICASIAVFGTASWVAYFDFLVEFQERIAKQTSSDFLNYSTTVLMAEQIMGMPMPLARAIQILVSLGTVLAVYWAFRQTENKTLRLILLLVGVSLATPFGFLYDLPFMAVATVLMVRVGLASGFLPFEVPLLAAVWLVPFISFTTATYGVPLAPWIHLSFFCFVLVRLRRERHAPSLTPDPETQESGA
jgi:alpha-1,2-mannosyltransferase